VVHVVEPGIGTYATACGDSIPVEFTVSSESPVAEVRLDGKVIPPHDGPYQGSFHPGPGLNVITAEATDDQKRRGRDHRALLCGTFAPPSEAVVHAGDLYLGKGAIKTMADFTAQTFDGIDLTARFAAFGPLYSSSIVSVMPGKLLHAPGTVVSLVPQWDRLAVHVDVWSLDASVVVELIGSPSKFVTIAIRADRVGVDGLMLLKLDESGSIQADLTKVEVAFDRIELEVEGIAENLLAVFPDYQEKLIGPLQDVVSNLVRDQAPKAITTALGHVSDPIAFDLLERSFEVRLKPSLVQLSPSGIHLGLDVAFTGLDPDPAITSPGVLHTAGDEEWASVDGIRLAVKDDLLNAVFHEAWRSVVHDVTIDQALLDKKKMEVGLVAGFLGGTLDLLPVKVDPETPIEIRLVLTYPPVASLDLPASGGIRLGIGDARIELRAPTVLADAPLLALSATIRFEGEVRTPGPGRLGIVFHAVNVDLDVIDDDGKFADVEQSLEQNFTGLLDSLGPLLSDLVHDVPLPSMGGLSLTNLEIGTQTQDGGAVVVRADIAIGPK
jgi:hypothetical protein